jgi:MFS family permease
MNLLRANAAFRRLWLARFVSFLGDSLGLVALIVYLSRRTDSGAVVGLLLLAGDLTPALLAPVVGVIADRTEARRTMVLCELAQGAAVGAIVVLQPATPLILVLVAVRSIVAGVFQATSRSVVAELVDDEDLERANTILGFGTHGLEALGALLAAALLLVVTARVVLAVDVATFLVSPLLLLRLPRVEVAVEVGAGVVRDVRAGLDAVWQLPLVRTLALTFWTFAVFTAADDVALPFLGRHDFGTGDAGVSLLYAGGGIGIVLGLLLIGRRSATPFVVAIAGLAVAGAGNALTGIAPAVAIAFLLQAVRGIGNAWVGVGTDTLVQREAPRAVRGRVFANVYGGVGIAAGVSYLVGGPLVDVAGPRAVLGVGGVCGLACAAIAAWASRSRVTRKPGSPTVPSP